MRQIVLDTNFLMIPAEHHIDIFMEIGQCLHEPYQLFIVKGSLQELDFIAAKGGQREKRQVKLTKALIKTQNIKIVDSDYETSVDDYLVELSKQGYVVATQDMALKRRIRNNIIVLRQKKYLTFIS